MDSVEGADAGSGGVASGMGVGTTLLFRGCVVGDCVVCIGGVWLWSGRAG